MSLDICAANKKNLDSFFGVDLIEEIFSGSIDDRIFGCRHHLRKSKHSCRAFINKKTEYISENYEPITPEVNLLKLHLSSYQRKSGVLFTFHVNLIDVCPFE